MTIPNPNGRFPAPGLQGSLPLPNPPQAQTFTVYLRGPGIDGLKPVAKISSVSATRAMLAFISQIGGDEFSIREIRIERDTNSLITPA